MLRDISLIAAFIFIGLSLWQLRFTRSLALRTITWIFVLMISTTFLIGFSKNLDRETKLILDAVFWTGELGLIGTYFWHKRYV